MSEVAQSPQEPELTPLPPVPKSLKQFWLTDLPSQVDGTEQEGLTYSAVRKATKAIQCECFAARDVRKALHPESNPTVALWNRMSHIEVAAGHLTAAADCWHEVGNLVLQALYNTGSTLDVEGIAYSTKARRALCLRQAGSLMAVLLEIDRKRLEESGHQPTVFL